MNVHWHISGNEINYINIFDIKQDPNTVYLLGIRFNTIRRINNEFKILICIYTFVSSLVKSFFRTFDFHALYARKQCHLKFETRKHALVDQAMWYIKRKAMP